VRRAEKTGSPSSAGSSTRRCAAVVEECRDLAIADHGKVQVRLLRRHDAARSARRIVAARNARHGIREAPVGRDAVADGDRDAAVAAYGLEAIAVRRVIAKEYGVRPAKGASRERPRWRGLAAGTQLQLEYGVAVEEFVVGQQRLRESRHDGAHPRFPLGCRTVVHGERRPLSSMKTPLVGG